MCRFRVGVGALALVWLGASGLQAANNPSGWIQTNGWNFLLPLTQNAGCGGGGAAFMSSTNWIAPHNIGSENPKAGDIWDGSGAGLELIDFGGAAGATGIVQGDLGLGDGAAVWSSNAFLFDNFGVAFPNGDIVDFQVVAETYAASICNAVPQPIISCPTPVPNDNVLGIATTYVENLTGAPLVVQVCTASDDSIQVYVNNCIVSNVSACRGTAGDCAETSTIALPPGVNKIAALVWEGGGGWGFRLALRKPDGTRYTDANSAGVLSFIGAGTDETGQANECVAISRDYVAQPQSCPLAGDESTTVTIKGVSTGDAGTMFHIEETINVFCPDALEISAVSDGGTVSETTSPDRTEPIIADLPEAAHIGNDTGGSASAAGSGLGPYTSVDSSSFDLWDVGDGFQFQYAEVTGDFDIAIEVLSAGSSTGVGRWGRYGLMARQIDEGEGAPAIEAQTFSRYTFVNAKLSSWVDEVTVQGRTVHDAAGAAGAHFNNDIQPDVLSARPQFMRLTRRGNTVQGWASNCDGLANGSADPYNDANWLAGTAHDYGASAPAKLFVGFANGDHDSSDPAANNKQTVEYRLLPAAPDGSNVKSVTIKWDVTRTVLNEGLSYNMKYAGKETSRHALSVIGQNVLGIPSGISGVPFNNEQTAVGAFAFAHDIGGPRSPGSTTYDAATDTYTLTGAGDDIWAGGDQFQYAYNAVTGDFDMSMRITERTHPQYDGRWGKHGLMARWTCDFNSRYSFLHANLSTDRSVIDEPRLARRVQQFNTGYTQEQYVLNDGTMYTTENDARNACRAGCADDACRANCDRASFPITRLAPWFRMIRRGNAIYTYLSEDNGGTPARWVFIGSDSDPNMPDTILAGVALTGHAGRDIGIIKFDHFKLEALAPCPEGSCSATGDPLVSADFESPGDLDAFTVAQSGGFAPAIVGGRLQLTNESTGGSGNAVWYATDGLNLAAAGFVVEFDAFMHRTGLPGDANPADGMTFAVVQGNKAFASGLRGDTGGSLGYEGNKLRDASEDHPSFAVEMDNWIGGGEPGNEPSGTASPDNDGKYHMGIDVNGSVSSILTNVEYTGTKDLPDIFAPEGIHVEVAYSNAGQIDVYVSANDGSFERTKVLSACIPPLQGADLLLGFTAGTGGATSTQEVDNTSVSAICCEPTDTVTIGGPESGTVGTPVAQTTTTGGLGGAGTFAWSVVSGPGTVINNNDGTATVNGTGPGDVVVKVTVDDGVCGGGGSDTHTISFSAGGGSQKPGDENQDGKLNLADAISILDHLFRGTNPTLPCGDGTKEDAANLKLLDSNGDGTINLADPIHELNYLFLGGPPPAACAGDASCPCVNIVDCPEACAD